MNIVAAVVALFLWNPTAKIEGTQVETVRLDQSVQQRMQRDADTFYNYMDAKTKREHPNGPVHISLKKPDTVVLAVAGNDQYRLIAVWTLTVRFGGYKTECFPANKVKRHKKKYCEDAQPASEYHQNFNFIYKVRINGVSI